MYKKIKSIEISANVIKFETDEFKGSVRSPAPFNFDSKLSNQRLEYDCNDDYKVVIFKNNLVVYQWQDVVLKFYLPNTVRYYIIKDVKTKGVFSLEYRKHLRGDYDCDKHVLVNMNGIDTESNPAFDRIVKKVGKYSKGVYKQPILIVFYDAQDDLIRYSIVSENVVVESGCETYDERKDPLEELPNIFDTDDAE